MTLKEAKEITGDLSKPSKMPGRAYNLPATSCKLGGKLVGVLGTVCSHCYALKGRYRFPAVRVSLAKRLQAIAGPRWVDGMVRLIQYYESPPMGSGYFRWHDSGDLQSVEHYDKILEICRLCPRIRFWLPTREISIVQASTTPVPSNLTVRISLNRIGQYPSSDSLKSGNISTVGSGQGYICPAPRQDNRCDTCRACWRRDVPSVDYRLH